MIKKLFLLLIRFYRVFLSPLKPPSCRYIPTCSEYAMIAIERYGALKGGWMAVKRVLRAHVNNVIALFKHLVSD